MDCRTCGHVRGRRVGPSPKIDAPVGIIRRALLEKYHGAVTYERFELLGDLEIASLLDIWKPVGEDGKPIPEKRTISPREAYITFLTNRPDKPITREQAVAEWNRSRGEVRHRVNVAKKREEAGAQRKAGQAHAGEVTANGG